MPAAQRRRPSRRGRLIAVIAAVVLAAAGAGAFLAVKAGYIGSRAPARPGSSRQVSPPASSAAPRSSSTGAAVMAALGRDLARSAAVRPTIQTAIDGVRNCSQSPSSGQAAMRQAISTRQGIVTGLQALSPAGLPSGARLISTLTTAMQHSITADRHYQGWMADFAASGSGCGSDPGQNPEYAAGQDASAAATTAKRAFLDLWNPMAPRYGQQTYASTDF